jgi:hypothetical protein
VTAALSNVPKIVQERLRAAAPEKAWSEGVPRAHPDADLLTAFAEQALSSDERQCVLDHLALCSDCREVVALALPAPASVPTSATSEIAAQADAARAVTVRAQQHWFAWSGFTWHGLRWAALAAGIVVAGAIILNQSKKPNQPLEARHQVENAMPEPAAPAAKPAAPAQADSEFASTAGIKPGQKTVESGLSRQLSRRLLNKESRVVADLKTAPAETAVTAGALRPPSMKKDLIANAAPASRGALSAPMPSVSEPVGIAGADAAVNTRDTFLVRNEAAPAISKAKAAMPAMDEAAAPPKSAELETKAAFGGNLRSREDAVNLLQDATIAAQWQVASGALQRSLDHGATWQTGLRSDRPLLCFAARGNEIWAGGKAGALFHSADGGANWTQVNPSADGRALSADVTRIEVRSSTEIVLSTSGSESWTTLDGGKTWIKK